MNASRVKSSALVAVFAIAALASATVFAQGPVDLSPPKRLESYPLKRAPQPTPPLPTMPAPVTNGVVGVEGMTMEPPKMGGVVQAETLDAVNPDVAGVLSEDQGGLGRDMWLGTDHRVLKALLTKIPVSTASPALRGLMHRLLLTGAQVPEGGEPGSLIALRAGQLLAMGDFTGVNALLKVVPGYADNPDLLSIEVDARLLTGDVARACQVANSYNENQSSTYWQKTFIFCQALEGKGEQAQLGVSLLQELGVEDDVFYSLVEAIATQSEPPVIERLPDPTPLHLALARVAKADLPADIISSNRPAVLRSIAISPNAPPELRLEAAERAEVAGALPVDALRQLYASIEFSAEDINSPLTKVKELVGPMSRALLYRSTLSQKVPAAQAEALSQALQLARLGGRYASTARAFLPQISRVKPSQDLVWFAPEAIRAFLITNRHDAVQGWFDLLKAAAEHDPESAAQLEAVLPLARLSDYAEASGWTMDRLSMWWDAVKSTEGAREKAAALASVFKALGEFVPDHMWVEMIEGPTHQALLSPHPSLWFLLDSAAERGRIGETILVSLVIVGEGGPARLSPIVLQRVLKAMDQIGFQEEARAMALEAVVAVGL